MSGQSESAQIIPPWINLDVHWCSKYEKASVRAFILIKDGGFDFRQIRWRWLFGTHGICNDIILRWLSWDKCSAETCIYNKKYLHNGNNNSCCCLMLLSLLMCLNIFTLQTAPQDYFPQTEWYVVLHRWAPWNQLVLNIRQAGGVCRGRRWGGAVSLFPKRKNCNSWFPKLVISLVLSLYCSWLANDSHGWTKIQELPSFVYSSAGELR